MPAQISPSHSRSFHLRRLPRSWTAVVAGGLIGSAARTAISTYLPHDSQGLPVATLTVNLTGSLLLGLYLARREQTVSAQWSLQFWAIGVFGSLTTLSAFSVEVFRLVDQGETMTAGLYVAASIVGGVALALLGQRIGSRVR